MEHSEISTELTGIDAWLSACLRRDCEGCRQRPEVTPGDLVHRMTYHGITGLLAEDRSLMEDLPAATAEEIRSVARGHAFQELAHRRVLTRLAPDFAAAGIAPLILKGTALAYSVYERPTMRPRGDTDLLVPEAAADKAEDILSDHGFAPWVTAGGRLRAAEQAYSLHDEHGLRHDIDLHWRINNSAVLARLFDYDELMSRAAPLARLNPIYAGPDPVDALIFASFHRYLHVRWPIRIEGVDHWAENRLIWLLDVARIAGRFNADDWETLVRRALDKGLGRICHGTLTAAIGAVGLTVPGSILAELDRAPDRERPARYLAAPGPIRLAMDLDAVGGPGRQLRFLRELAFPPAAYMRSEFGRPGHREGLPRLYLRRAMVGIAKLAHQPGIEP